MIVTNNPNVKENYEDVLFVEGTFEDVLINVRDLVYFGHELISHPLGSSIRMLFSPYRSIVVGENTGNIKEVYVEIIESSIANYKKHMEVRKPDIENYSDYALIDSELLSLALEEHKRNLEVNYI